MQTEGERMALRATARDHLGQRPAWYFNPATRSPLTAYLLLGVALLCVPCCSEFNREGPLVTCEDLKGGAINACKDGIIASCLDGKEVTYEVCTDDVGETAAEDLCDASWQSTDAYQCEDPQNSPNTSPTPKCFPPKNYVCYSCLERQCLELYKRCASDAACSSSCSGSFADDLVPCVKHCADGGHPCSSADFPSSAFPGADVFGE